MTQATTGVLVNDRAAFVKNRLLEIGKSAADLILESGLLLSEYKDNAYHREHGFESFDEAIDAMQSAGQIDFGARQARNLIAVFQMVDRLKLPQEELQSLGISKLREIATLKDDKDKRKLLAEAAAMSVADVQKAAKQVRDKAAGRDVDPLSPVTLMFSETQKTFYKECIATARTAYGIDDNVPEAAVLVDSLLAEWSSGVTLEAGA